MTQSADSELRVVLIGAGGKMGRALTQLIVAAPGVKLVGAIDREGSAAIGSDAGVMAGLPPISVRVTGSVEAALSLAQVIIDFSAPAATVEAARVAAERGIPMVIGTTGLTDEHMRQLRDAATRIAIVQSGNMSLGVNLLLGLLRQTARALGPAFDVEIVELHHRQKRDAPSGTALLMANAIAETRGRSLAEDARYGRHGTPGPRTTDEIGIMSVRGGDIVGDHTAYFCGIGERLELTHRASSRDTFAQGALRAAEWVIGKTPALYEMEAVLGLKGS